MTRTLDTLTPTEARELLAAHERAWGAHWTLAMQRATCRWRDTAEAEAFDVALRNCVTAREDLNAIRARLGLDGAT